MKILCFIYNLLIKQFWHNKVDREGKLKIGYLGSQTQFFINGFLIFFIS